MDFPTLMTELGRLGIEVQRFAVTGAALQLRANGEPFARGVEASFRDAITAVLPGALDGLKPDDVRVAVNYVIFQMEEARELLRDPARPPTWRINDPDVLQSMGDLSRMLPRRMLAFAANRPALAKAMTGRFLDVGTGVGAIALEAAARCPTLTVVGLDIWDPALELARANVAASPDAARIEIRKQSITDLNEAAAYTVAFLAAPFMDQRVVEAALDRLAAAIAPDGYLVVSIYIPTADKVVGALTELRRVRSGGHSWSTDDMSAAISARGFVDIELQPGPPALSISPTLIFARRPTAIS